MTPAEQLAAARSNVAGPYVVAQAAWVEAWSGPAVVRTRSEPEYGRPSVRLIPVVIEDGCVLSGDNDFTMGEPGIFPVERHDYDALLLDLRRPEVRDHLVRRGAPAGARDVAPALWVWATTGKVPRRPTPKWVQFGEHYVRAGSPANSIASVCDTRGWAHGEDFGPETGPEGMACADLAALSHGCILEEADGWLLPLPDGGIGFWPREGA